MTPAGPAEASTYDSLPYLSHAFPQTHPDRLAAIATIFRLTPPPVTSCRVLELGCASGGNLIPMASQLPGSEFVGLDLSARQVDDGRRAIAALALRNARIEHASILDIDPSWGMFDYVICHGVYSWVEREVQDRILDVASRHLTPDGIAYISYNTYPGWHLRHVVRDMMLFHGRQFADAGEQVEQARAFVAFAAASTRAEGGYAQLLQAEAERMRAAPESYVFHEHLERTNLPLYFHEFVARCEAAGLQFLAEASLSDMLTAHFPREVAETLEHISPDLVHLEQYMDFLRNRQFRQTLVCHDERRPERALAASALEGLLLSSPATASDVELTDGVPAVFSSGTHRAEVTKPANKAAFGILMEAWPRALPVGELSELALRRARPFLNGVPEEEARPAMLEDLFGAAAYGLARVHTVAPGCTNEPGVTPRAQPVAAYQAGLGNIVVNAHHEMIQLDALALETLKLCDGSRSRAVLTHELRSLLEHGAARLEEEVADAIAAGALPELVDDAIGRLTRHALLAPAS